MWCVDNLVFLCVFVCMRACIHACVWSQIVKMNKHPSSASGDTEPINSMLMLYQGGFIGTRLSSGTPVVNFIYLLAIITSVKSIIIIWQITHRCSKPFPSHPCYNMPHVCISLFDSINSADPFKCPAVGFTWQEKNSILIILKTFSYVRSLSSYSDTYIF